MSLLVAQISDSHIAHDQPQRVADLENCIRHINAENPQPDLVIHTGDIVHNGLAEEYTIARSALDSLVAPCFVLPGNKDKRPELISAFADEQTIRKDSVWIQYSIESLEVRLVMADTLHLESNKGQFCQERLAHLEQMLAADSSRAIAMFMHHPPFAATGIPDPYQFEDWVDAERIHTLVKRFDNICGVYCGHVHRNIQSDIDAVHASTITCVAGDLRKGDVSDQQRAEPAYRLLQLP